MDPGAFALNTEHFPIYLNAHDNSHPLPLGATLIVWLYMLQ